MFRKTFIAALLATVAVAATQPANAAIEPNGTLWNGIGLNGTAWNGGHWNGTSAGAQSATVIAIELPQPE